jgi:long-chain acyl-CoA synthetase
MSVLARAPAPADDRVFTVHGQDTLPRLFRHVVRVRGDRPALREKHLGIWRSISWREYGEKVRQVGLGLVALGLRPKDVVSVIADNCPEWLYADLGTMSAGGVTNGIYTTDSPAQVEYIVNDSGTRFFFAENEEQLDKILAVRARCPQLVRIVVFDTDGLHAFRDDQVMSFDALLELGAGYDRAHPGAWDDLVEMSRPGDLAILVYTSGTTGPPKGAMLSHRNILFQLGFSDFLTTPREGDQQLSFLPLSHVAERTFTVFYPLASGATVNFAESIDTVPDNLREVAPTVFFAVPRIWEKFYSAVALRMREATLLGKLAYGWAIRVGMRRAERRAGRRDPRLIVMRRPLRTGAGHDDGQPRSKERGIAHIRSRTHDASAATLDGRADSLRQDVLGRVVIARQDRDGERGRGPQARPLRAFTEPIDAGAQHRHPALRVEREVVDPQRAEHAGRAVDGRRDVVELEIEEHPVAEVGERPDRFGPGRAEQLETDLGGAEPGAKQAAEPDRLDEIVDVEREGQPVTGGDPFRGGLLRAHCPALVPTLIVILLCQLAVCARHRSAP